MFASGIRSDKQTTWQDRSVILICDRSISIILNKNAQLQSRFIILFYSIFRLIKYKSWLLLIFFRNQLHVCLLYPIWHREFLQKFFCQIKLHVQSFVVKNSQTLEAQNASNSLRRSCPIDYIVKHLNYNKFTLRYYSISTLRSYLSNGLTKTLFYFSAIRKAYQYSAIYYYLYFLRSLFFGGFDISSGLEASQIPLNKFYSRISNYYQGSFELNYSISLCIELSLDSDPSSSYPSRFLSLFLPPIFYSRPNKFIFLSLIFPLFFQLCRHYESIWYEKDKL